MKGVRPCKACGTAFTPVPYNSNRRYCTPECRTANKPKRPRAPRRWYPNLLGPYDASTSPAFAFLTLRPTYHPTISRALHDLAESNPTPSEYAQRKEAILASNP